MRLRLLPAVAQLHLLLDKCPDALDAARRRNGRRPHLALVELAARGHNFGRPGPRGSIAHAHESALALDRATARALADRDEAVEAGPRRADVAARDRGHSGALIDLALAACGDERAAAVLHTAYTLLMEQADAIAQPDWRRSFLEHIAVHRVILAEAEPLGLTAQEAER